MRRVLRLLAAAAVLALAYAAVWHWDGTLYGIGVRPVPQGTSPFYQLLSGFIPALTVVSLATLLTGLWHGLNCHEPGCWRLGKHKVNGTPWCNRHHAKARPELTAEQLLEALIERFDLLAGRLAPPQEPSAVKADFGSSSGAELVRAIWPDLKAEIRRRGGGGAGSVQKALGP